MSEEKKEITQEEVAEVKEQVSVAPEKKKKGGKGPMIVILLVVVAAVAYGVLTLGGDKSDGGTAGNDADAVVASVYDVDITRGELDEKMDQLRLSLGAGQPDPAEDAGYELQLLQDLVDLELLKRTAMEKNYTVTSDDVDAEVALIVEQFPSEEEFYAQLETVGITEEELRDNIDTELHIRQLLDDETDMGSIVVTDEEIQGFYDASVGDAEDAPAFEDVSEIIRAQILNQKSAEVVQTYLQGLRDSAGDSITISL